MTNKKILLMLHCEQHTGYAIGILEKVFFDAAIKAGFSEPNIYWSFSKISDPSTKNTIECVYKNADHARNLDKFLTEQKITLVLAFDLGYPSSIIPILKKHKVNIISYWGASISSINTGIKLLLKKIEWFIRPTKPDYFIFESNAMQLTATHGRGIPHNKTCVIPLGVDTDKFYPEYENYFYAHEQLGIPRSKKIVFYSGHMEERKGVHVIMQAAIALFDRNPEYPVHFVICGNKHGEEERFLAMLSNTEAHRHVTFAGYRTDIEKLMRSSSVGVIASTGWDSFTMSSVEMMSSGLPLIVSNLQGLAETIINDVNGFHISPGDHSALADRLIEILSNDSLRLGFSQMSRERAVNNFSRQVQVDAFTRVINNHTKNQQK
jgi:glycosyltransferase involved in cell wall biosynthesis